MRDFTLKIYRQLLEAFIKKGYQFIRYDDSLIENSKFKIQNSKIVILRHDVDLLPGNSLATAKIENELGIKGTYYFRIVPESFDEKIIKQIAELGHEIGYHYEEVDTAYRQLKIKNSKLKIDPSTTLRITKRTNNQQQTIIDLAYEMFKKNLEKIRSVVPITTICMHGSPLSPYNNKDIWSKYDYKDLGVIGEPYFDIDWNEFGYLTDTGRRWNGSDVSVRDKVSSNNVQSSIINAQSAAADRLKSTQDIINALEQNKLPDKLMITVHPQRWTDNYVAWVKELVLQNVKNQVKKLIVKRQR
ncbi:MAG: hypothetical protein WAU11_13125 [Ignavibacteriaceae bacterium]